MPKTLKRTMFQHTPTDELRLTDLKHLYIHEYCTSTDEVLDVLNHGLKDLYPESLTQYDLSNNKNPLQTGCL